jgi:dynein heavy chain
MYSSEGEYVEFLQEVNTNIANGNVDTWLSWVEERMIDAIHYCTDKAFDEYNNMPRKKWVIGRCGMAVLSVDMTYWTYETEKALNEEGNNGVGKYQTKLEKQVRYWYIFYAQKQR